jgi:cell division protein FtsL
MSSDKFQNKYNEIFHDIKEEKMDWDFEDFLKKAEGKEDEVQEESKTPIIPIDTKAKPSFPKWFWMAASVVLLLSIGFIFNYNQKSNVEDQSQLVENQIKQQKNNFIEENNDHNEQVAVNHPNDSLSGAKKDSIFQENTVAEKDFLDEILPKRGRMKKERKPKYVYNSSKASDSTGYKDSYVIVNGKRIENVEEAINVTKYSFQIFANNVSEKLVKPAVVDDDY